MAEVYHRATRVAALVVLFFYSWSFGGVFDIAYAVGGSSQRSALSGQQNKQRPEERLQRDIEDIEGILADNAADPETKKDRLRGRKADIEGLDIKIREQFKETEDRIKDLPEAIKQRHRDFVKKYEDNLSAFKAHLDDIDRSKTASEKEHAHNKAKEFLERVKPPKKHTPIDPNRLPHSMAEPVYKEPRTTPWGISAEARRRESVKVLSDAGLSALRAYELANPVLVASNGLPDGLLSSERTSLPAYPLTDSMLLAATDPPISNDLSETIEIQFTPAIKAEAAELEHDPVKIYNWVRNNIEFVPTYGSIQGADMCLQTKLCNAFDTSSLLIALLRVSGIHARYVEGTVEIPIEKVMNWLGGFTDPNAALDLIASGGIPVKGLTSGGRIVAARMEHVWVEAWVDYFPSRGARHKAGQGKVWIPLDASFKQYSYTQGIDMQSEVPFDAQALIDQIRTTADFNEAEGYITGVDSSYIDQMVSDYLMQMKDYIRLNYTDATIGDILGKKELVRQEFPYLLGTLPYRIILRGMTYSDIPDIMRHKVTFGVSRNLMDNAKLSITINMPELAGKRITLSYSPATPNDEAVINSYLPKPHADGTPIGANELPTSLAAYLIQLKPELRIDGQVIGTGSSVGMGATENFIMKFSGPNVNVDIIQNDVKAGEYIGIGLDTGRVSREQMTAIRTRLENTKAKMTSGNFHELTQDDVFGEMLYITAMLYNARMDGYDIVLSQSVGVRHVRVPSETIFQTIMDVDYVFGIPVRAIEGGLMMDADRNKSIVKALDGDNRKDVLFMHYSGIYSSAMEHRVPEQLLKTEDSSAGGVSAVKALMAANGSGIPIYTITKGNINMVLPMLQVDADVINDIRNAVNAGKEVIVSKTNIDYNGWTGCGYVIVDPSTGSGGYMISGGSSGAIILNSLGFSPFVLSKILQRSNSWDDVRLVLTKFVGFEVTEPKDWCGSTGTEWVPDYPFGVDAQIACISHDNCYVTAETPANKLICDSQLGMDLFYDCVAEQGNDVRFCGAVGGIYAVAVVVLGWKAWDDARQ